MSYINASFSKRGRGRPPAPKNKEKKCTTPGCKGKHLARGLCRKCYDAQPDRVKKRNEWLQKQPEDVRKKIAKRAYNKMKNDPKRHERFKKKVRKYSREYNKTEEARKKRREYARRRMAKMTPEERSKRAKKYYLRMRNDPKRWEKHLERMRKYQKKRNAELKKKK